MNALTAKEITRNSKNLQSQYQHLIRKIRDAAFEGRHALEYGKVEPEVLHKLEDDGFEVSVNNRVDPTVAETVILWSVEVK